MHGQLEEFNINKEKWNIGSGYSGGFVVSLFRIKEP